MSIIKIQNLTFAYPGTYVNIFENVNLSLDSDWKLGFTGRNGRGKTTFLKLLLGQYPFTGTLQTKVLFEYFPYEIENRSEYTYEVVAQIVPDYEHWQLQKEMNLLEVSEDCLYRPFDTLSQGEQTKLQMIMLFLKHNRFLLIDEPTNHLDTRGRMKMRAYLNSKKGFIVVSHDREFLDGCTDHTLSINKTKIEIEQGNYSSFLTNKAYRDQNEMMENEKLHKQIDALSQAIRRTAGWSNALEATKVGNGHVDRGYIGAKSAKLMKRVKSFEKRQENAIHEKEKLLKDIESAEALELKPMTFRAQKLMNIQDLCIAYDSKVVVEHLSFSVERGDRIAIKGQNGTGKSSIIKAIMREIPCEGSVYIPKDLTISYVNQDTSNLEGLVTTFIDESGVEPWLFRSMLSKLDFSLELFEKKLEQLSEGQKKKVLLAKSLCERADLYIWDEPLNFVDIHSREQIENVILTYQPTMIFVEHDCYFNEHVATKTIEL